MITPEFYVRRLLYTRKETDGDMALLNHLHKTLSKLLSSHGANPSHEEVYETSQIAIRTVAAECTHGFWYTTQEGVLDLFELDLS